APRPRRRLVNVVRLDADRRRQHLVLPGQLDAADARRGRRGDRDNAADAGGGGALEDGRQVRLELLVVEVRMRVDQVRGQVLVGCGACTASGPARCRLFRSSNFCNCSRASGSRPAATSASRLAISCRWAATNLGTRKRSDTKPIEVNSVGNEPM